MTWSRFPCVYCGEPFDDEESLRDHWGETLHGPEVLQEDALLTARLSTTGDLDAVVAHATARRRLRLIHGGRRA